MMQPMPRSSSFPQVFIYSLPCILCLQIFLLQEGFLRRLLQPVWKSFILVVSVSHWIVGLNHSSKLPLIWGFLCLHKGTLQEPGRVNENSFSGINMSFKSCLDWFSPLDSCSVSPVQQSRTAIPLSPILTIQDLLCFRISLWEFYGKTEHIFYING